MLYTLTAKYADIQSQVANKQTPSDVFAPMPNDMSAERITKSVARAYIIITTV